MVPLLSALPGELIEIIASTLDLPSYRSLRLTCKGIERKVLHHFGQRYFASLPTDMTSKSLRKLQAISQTEQFRHQVRTLRVQHHPHSEGPSIGQGLTWIRNGDLVDTQHSPGVKLLKGILKQLVNCKSFKITSCTGIEEYEEPEPLVCTDAIGIFLSIIAEIDLAPKSFVLDFPGGCLAGKRLQLQLLKQPSFIAAWSNLKELSLEYDIEGVEDAWTRDLLLHATGLRKLFLSLHHEISESFVDYLASSPALFQRLEELRLHSIRFAAKSLLAILSHCRQNLRILRFFGLEVHHGNWFQVLAELRKFQSLEDIEFDSLQRRKERTRIYQHFLALHITTCDPKQPLSDGLFYRGLFFDRLSASKRAKGHGGRHGLVTIGFRGRANMDKALEVLLETMEPPQE